MGSPIEFPREPDLGDRRPQASGVIPDRKEASRSKLFESPITFLESFDKKDATAFLRASVFGAHQPISQKLVAAVRSLRDMASPLEAKTMSRAVTVSGGPSSLRQVISVGRHQLFADEPKAPGGHDEGPDPYALKSQR